MSPLALVCAFAMGSDADPYESFGAVDTAAVPPATAAEGPARPASAEPPRPSFVVFNTLGLPGGRIGFDFGSMLAAHLAPMGSVHGQVPILPKSLSHSSLFGLGGELGIRAFTSAWRPAGAFIGTYLLAGRYRADNDAWLSSFGAAVDLGWSTVTKSDVVVSLGGGIEYRIVKNNGIDVPNIFVRNGFGPRGLVQVGKAF